MDNEKRSQDKKEGGWGDFLDEAKRRFADAKTAEERRELRDSIRRFERLIRRKVRIPRKTTQSHRQAGEQQHSV